MSPLLPVVRGSVRFVAALVLPTLIPASAYLAFRIVAPGRSGPTLGLACLAASGLAGVGYLESAIYACELRSVVPRPVNAAGGFLLALGLLFGLALAAFGAAAALAMHAGSGRCLGLCLGLGAAASAYLSGSAVVIAPGQEFVRGRKYRSFREVYGLSLAARLFGRRGSIFFGGIRLPWSAAVKHWLILGVTGSGKTMIFQLLMQDILRGRIGPGRDERGIVYDNKTELIPVLAALRVPFKIVNPFDRRGVAVDFPSLVPTHTASLEVASILMGRAKDVGSDPFWVEAPRNLLAAVMTSLRLGVGHGAGAPVPIRWDLRDLVLIMQSQETIREVIGRHPETASDVEGCFDDPRLLANVMATVKTQMMYYRPVAACWHRSPERISLADAVRGDPGYVLVLGNDEQFRRAIDPIVRVVITRYGQLALKRPRSETRRISLFLDEFSDLKRIEPDLVMGLLTKGRSKGISVLLGVQSLSSILGEYGKDVAKVILSQCQNIAILGLGDLDDVTAEYASRVIGQIERIERRESETRDGLASRRGSNEDLRSRSVVLSSEFSDLPETARGNGLAGYYRTRSIQGFWGAVIPGEFLGRELVRPRRSVAALEERDEADHELRPWDEADRARLGLVRMAGSGAMPRPGRPRPIRVYRGGKPRPPKVSA